MMGIHKMARIVQGTCFLVDHIQKMRSWGGALTNRWFHLWCSFIHSFIHSFILTLPKTNSSPLKIGGKRSSRNLFQPPCFTYIPDADPMIFLHHRFNMTVMNNGLNEDWFPSCEDAGAKSYHLLQRYQNELEWKRQSHVEKTQPSCGYQQDLQHMDSTHGLLRNWTVNGVNVFVVCGHGMSQYVTVCLK